MILSYLTRAWALITQDVIATAQICLVLWLISLFPFHLTELLYYGESVSDFADDPIAQTHWSEPFIFALVMFITVLCWVWIAVAWHRYGLKQERPSGLVPMFRGSEIRRYVMAVIAIFFIGLFVAAPVFILWIVADSWSYYIYADEIVEVTPTSTYLLYAVVMTVLNYVGFRLGLILPAAALGERMSFAASRDATRALRGPIFGLSVFFAVLAAIGFMVTDSVYGQPVLYVLSYAVHDIIALFGLCVLTLLYADLVEARSDA